MSRHIHARRGDGQTGGRTAGTGAAGERQPSSQPVGEEGPPAAADLPVHGAEQVADALVAAVGAARWPDGSLLVDLHPDLIRTRLAPALAAELDRVPGSVTVPTVVTRTDQQGDPR